MVGHCLCIPKYMSSCCARIFAALRIQSSSSCLFMSAITHLLVGCLIESLHFSEFNTSGVFPYYQSVPTLLQCGHSSLFVCGLDAFLASSSISHWLITPALTVFQFFPLLFLKRCSDSFGCGTSTSDGFMFSS